MSDPMLWWGYRHVNGTFHTKRYFGPEDIAEANESHFCEQIYGPFEAPNIDEARRWTFSNLRKYP